MKLEAGRPHKIADAGANVAAQKQQGGVSDELRTELKGIFKEGGRGFSGGVDNFIHAEIGKMYVEGKGYQPSTKPLQEKAALAAALLQDMKAAFPDAFRTAPGSGDPMKRADEGERLYLQAMLEQMDSVATTGELFVKLGEPEEAKRARTILPQLLEQDAALPVRTATPDLGALEGAGQRSKELRENSQGGMFAGQTKVSLSSSPALQGANLKVPSDVAKEWKSTLDGLNYVIDRVKQGRLGSPAADVEIQALAAKAGDINALWSSAGTTTRHELQGAMDELARVLPHAIVATTPGAEPGTIIERRADESALSGHMNEAIFVGDKTQAKKLARDYLAKFPDAPMAPWAKNILADK